MHGIARHFVQHYIVQLKRGAIRWGQDHCLAEMLQGDFVDDFTECRMDQLFLRVSEIYVVVIQINDAAVDAVAHSQEPRRKVEVIFSANVVRQRQLLKVMP